MAIDPQTGMPTDPLPPWIANLPSLASPSAQRGNWATAGFGAGLHGMLSDVGSAFQGLGTFVSGAPPATGDIPLTSLQGMGQALARGAGRFASSQEQAEQASARPDLEQNPWSLPGIGYQIAKAVPQVGAMLGAGMLVPAEAAPAWLTKLGTMAPRLIGGGAGLEEGAAAAKGLQFARNIVGATATGLPLTIGSNVQEAEAAHPGEPLSREEAAKAAALGGIEAPLYGLLPAELRGAEGAPGNLAMRILKGAAIGAPTQAVVGAAQTALTQLMGDPNRPVSDRAHEIVEAAMSGGLIGSVFGGVAGVFHGPDRPAAMEKPSGKVSNEDLKEVTAGPLGRQPTTSEVPPEMPAAPAVVPPEAAAASPQTPAVLRSVYADMENDALRKEINTPSAAKNDVERTAETAKLSEAKDELARRTMPGLEPGQGTLLDPKQIADLQPAIENQKDAALALIGKPDSAIVEEAKKNPFFKQFAAKDEPDLVNALLKEAKAGDVPKVLEPVMEEYGIKDGTETAKTFLDEEAKLKPLMEKAYAAKQEGAGTKKSRAAAEQNFNDLRQQINHLNDLAGFFEEARKRIDAALPSSTGGGPVTQQDQDGKPTEPQVYRGYGRDEQGAPYNPTGAAVPIAGQARYYSFDQEHAKTFGPEIEAVNPSDVVHNPLTITDGKDWRALTKEAGWTAPNPYGSDPQTMMQKAEDLKALVVKKGYDGLAINWDDTTPHDTGPKGEDIKLLRNVFDKPQVISYRPEAPNAVQFKSPTGVLLQPAAEVGAGMGGINPQRDVAGEVASGSIGQTEGQETPIQKIANTEFPTNTVMEPPPEPPSTPAEMAPRATSNAAQTAQARRDQLIEMQKTETDLAKQKIINAALVPGVTPAGLGRALRNLEKINPPPKEAMIGYGERVAPKEDMAGVDPWADTPRVTQGDIKTPVVAGGWADQVLNNMRKLGAPVDSVVWSNERTALVKAFDAAGETVYVPVDRFHGQLSDRDIRQPINLGLPTSLQIKLKNEAYKAEEIERRIYSKPGYDGPFKDAQSPVIGTPNTDPRLVGLAAGAMRHLGLGQIRILIVGDPNDVWDGAGSQLGLNGEYHYARSAGNPSPSELGHMRQFGTGAKDFYVYIKPGMSEGVQVETLAHEIGHVVQTVALRNAPPQLVTEIWQQHDKFYQAATGATKQELMQMLRNRESAGMMLHPGEENMPVSSMSKESHDYFLSREEWFADQVSRYFSTAPKATDIVGRFFQTVAQKMKQLLQYVTGKQYLPDPVVKAWLDTLEGRPEYQWQAERLAMKAGWQKFPEEDTSVHAARPAESEADVNEYTKTADDLLPRVKEGIASGSINLSGAVRRGVMLVNTRQGFTDAFESVLPAIRDHYNAWRQQNAIIGIKNKVFMRALEPWTILSKNQKVAAVVQQLMRNSASEPRLDYQKTFRQQLNEHPEWRTKDGGYISDIDELSAKSDQLNKDYSWIKQNGGGAALDSLRMIGQLERHQEVSASLHQWVHAMHPELFKDNIHSAFLVNSDELFQNKPEAFGDPAAALAHYKDTTASQLEEIRGYLIDKDALAAPFKNSNPDKYAAMRAPDDDLRAQVALAENNLKQAEGVYFPLAREGDYYVGSRFVRDENGNVKPEAVEALQNAVVAGHFNDIGVFDDPKNDSMFVRVSSEGQARALVSIFKTLEGQGHLVKDATTMGYPEKYNTLANLGPKYLSQMAEMARNSIPDLGAGATKEERDAVEMARNTMASHMMLQYLDTLPVHTLSKFLQPRTGASGFDINMAKSLAVRAQISSNASTKLGMAAKFADVNQMIRQQVQDAKFDPKSGVTAGDIARELQVRTANSLNRVSFKAMDVAQSITNTITIGASPAFTIEMLSQIPMLLHGELAKKMGYANSAQAIITVGARALKATIAGFKDGTFSFYDDTLKEKDVSDNDRRTIMNASKNGTLENNTWNQEMIDMGVGADPRTVRLSNYANFLGVLSEMYVRVLSGLAAADLYDKHPERAAGMSREQYVDNIISGSQFNWGPGEASRLTSRYGPLGPYTRISLAFMGFQTHMLEKLFKEGGDAIFGMHGPQVQKEAKMFLMTHLIATTVLAGTLGLPAAGIVAGVADTLAKEFTGRDDVDVQSLYRSWLANVFGPGVSDVLAKGLPRAFGMDLSRLGDQDLIPTTHFWQEKRKFEDSYDDFLRSMAGSAPADVTRVFLGGRDMMNGDYLQGAAKMLPELVKSPMEAAYFAKHGYVDQYGTKFPMQPKATDILMSAIGIDPQNYAQYQEANKIVIGQRAQEQTDRLNIVRHLDMAMKNPDSADYQTWANKAMQFQQRYPSMTGGPLMDAVRMLSQQMIRAAVGQERGAPMNAPIIGGGMLPTFLPTGVSQ